MIGARRSHLARLQAHLVGQALKTLSPDIEIEFLFKASVGDLNPDQPLTQFSKGAFTEDFIADLTAGRCDVVVHSWKDLPTESHPLTEVVATLPRADVRDLFLVPKTVVQRQPSRLRILASSPRRIYNLTPLLPDLLPWSTTVEFEPVRGNVPTRIEKLLKGDGDGLIVAKAAVDRLLNANGEEFADIALTMRAMIDQCKWMVLPLSANPAAAAQGALALEILRRREDLKQLLQGLNDPLAFSEVREERRILAGHGGGCHQKIGVSVLSRPYGIVTCLKGLTDSGQVLSTYATPSSSEGGALGEENIFPLDSANPWFERQPLPTDHWRSQLLEAEALWIARASAWPQGITTSPFLWTAGVKSWQALAERGLWVHGCADQLGEEEDPRLDTLVGRRLRWTYLTHTEAARGQGRVATYRLEPKNAVTSLQGKTHFFWSSGSSFARARELFPQEIERGHHSCGPGKTRHFIRRELGREPQVFLSWSQWRQSVLSARE